MDNTTGTVTGDHIQTRKHADRTIIAVQPLKRSEMQVRTAFRTWSQMNFSSYFFYIAIIRAGPWNWRCECLFS